MEEFSRTKAQKQHGQYIKVKDLFAAQFEPRTVPQAAPEEKQEQIDDQTAEGGLSDA